MDQTKILEDVNAGMVNSIVTGNPVDVRSLLGAVTEQDGRIVKAEVDSFFGGKHPELVLKDSLFINVISGNFYTMVRTGEHKRNSGGRRIRVRETKNIQFGHLTFDL